MLISGYLFIVTGGARGLGEQVVRSLVEHGAFVSILDVNVELAEKLVEELGHDKCYFYGSTDVSKEAEVDIALTKTLAHFPNATVGGAVLSSGIVSPPASLSGYGPDLSLTSYQQFEHVIKVNLLGTYCVAQKVSELLLKNEPMNQDGERGIIITVSSILGLDGLMVGYGTSKAGIAGLTLPLAKELSPFGIRVMSVAPGVFDTPIVDRSSSKATPVGLFPKRLGTPTEFSDLVLQIIQMPMLNGSVIRLDGALRA
ncbi:hypothetical protein V8B55DRAFT_1485923 [Mucor lusitanicus]|uniref:3-hydroxyacyl-CoA dehydrogenase n=2 Tax=Mucor circinelloides f. lusitanicus TaxID=29924 RepID=A0A162YK72_MUCCL|nr:hypothetical protein FB192DRAFT_1030798 [Mucor lusitanicus]OAC99076.1 hypothetical protein MUCCIDRAFT_114253 [Mucor lusitanicus CBS 277.49]